MFVDDDIDVITIVEEYATMDVHKNTVFMIKGGGWAALNYLKRWKYDVDAVVLDLKMPDMGGMKLTQRIREGEKRQKPDGEPMKIFWYTGLRFPLDDRFDPYTVCMTEYNVEHVFFKPCAPTDVIDEVVRRLRKPS